MHTAKVRMQTQTGSELPGLLICTRSATLTTQRTNTHTHTLWSFNWTWFTHTWINTSDHRMQILVPYIGLNNPGTISCLICNAHHHGSISGFRYGLWGQFSMCSLSPSTETQNPKAPSSYNILRHWTQISRYQAPMKTLKVTASQASTNDRFLVANPSLHSFSANNILLHTAQMQCKILQTHILFPICLLSLLHAPKSKARTPSDFHHSSASPSITTASRHYTAAQQDTGATEKISNSLSSVPKPSKNPSIQLTTQNAPPLPFSPQKPTVSFLASCTSFPCIRYCPLPKNHKPRRFFFFLLFAG